MCKERVKLWDTHTVSYFLMWFYSLYYFHCFNFVVFKTSLYMSSMPQHFNSIYKLYAGLYILCVSTMDIYTRSKSNLRSSIVHLPSFDRYSKDIGRINSLLCIYVPDMSWISIMTSKKTRLSHPMGIHRIYQSHYRYLVEIQGIHNKYP